MKVEYEQTPPQVFVARMNRFIQESQLPGLKVQLKWVRIKEDKPQSHSTDNETEQQGSTGSYINKHSENVLSICLLFSRHLSESP